MRLHWPMNTILYCRFFDCKVDIVHFYLLVVGCDVVVVVVCVVELTDAAVPEKIKNGANHRKKMSVLKLTINILLLLLNSTRHSKHFYNSVKTAKRFEKVIYSRMG